MADTVDCPHCGARGVDGSAPSGCDLHDRPLCGSCCQALTELYSACKALRRTLEVLPPAAPTSFCLRGLEESLAVMFARIRGDA